MKYFIFSVFPFLLSAFYFDILNTRSPLPIPTTPAKYYKWDEFCTGVDLSYVNQVEDYGAYIKI